MKAVDLSLYLLFAHDGKHILELPALIQTILLEIRGPTLPCDGLPLLPYIHTLTTLVARHACSKDIGKIGVEGG